MILRDGPARLSGRAVTGEAGVAAGLLYAHFTDLDDFLTAYAVDRTFTISATAAALPERAGQGDVAANLAAALAAIPGPPLAALAKLLVLRPELTTGVHKVLGDRTAGFEAIERSIAEYLTAESELGRIPETVNPAALALALVGVLHHLILTENADRLEEAVKSLAHMTTKPAPSEPKPR